MQQLLFLDKPLEEDEGRVASDDDSDEHGLTSSRRLRRADRCIQCGKAYGDEPAGLLSCLHIVCRTCRSLMVSEGVGDRRLSPSASMADSLCSLGESNALGRCNKREIVHCPKCRQATPFSMIETLQPADVVVATAMPAVVGRMDEQQQPVISLGAQLCTDAAFADAVGVVCTSCKARETAVARCCDCDSYICSNCVTAHHYMRCFEGHKVLPLPKNNDSKTKSGDESASLPLPSAGQPKPPCCPAHSQELLTLFCKECQIPVCEQCVGAAGAHWPISGHHWEKITAALELREGDQLRGLVGEARAKVQMCANAAAELQMSLASLQNQRDDAKSRLFETLQSYKAVLEKQYEAVLRELEEVHGEQELTVMDSIELLNRTAEQIEDGCAFAEKVLKKGETQELLRLKKAIASQLLMLINNVPKCDEIADSRLVFHTDPVNFTTSVQLSFGCIKAHNSSPPRRGCSVSPGSSCHVQDDSLNLSPASAADNSFDAGGSRNTVSAVGSKLTGLSQPVQPTSQIANIASSSELCISQDAIGSSLLPSDYDIADISCGRSYSVDALSAVPSSMPLLDSPTPAVTYFRGFTNSLPALPGPACSSNSIADRTASRQSLSPTMSDSGIGMDAPAAATGSATGPSHACSSGLGHPPLAELTMLSRIGSMSIGHQDITGVSSALMGSGLTGSSMRSEMSSLESLAASLPSTFVQQPPQVLQPQHHRSALQSPVMGTGASSIPRIMAPASAILGGSSAQRPFSPGRHQSVLARSQSKMTAMQIRFKFGQLGPLKGQFNSPHGFCLGCDEDIIVADTNNHRVQVFEKTGEFKYQFGVPGRDEGQLWYPRKVAVIRSTGRFVVCDRGNERSRMQIFTKSGHFLKKIAIRYIDIVAGLAITSQGNIVAVDSVSPTVFCISEGGDLIKWFDCSDYMREPSDIAISGNEYFVCDFKGHCVVVFNEDGKFLRRIGSEAVTNYPNGIDVSDAGDVLVGDSHGNRFHVAVFQRDGFLIGEFECPYVKVSRCCGLKITSEGHVVTLAKNNHHVLILNTLYIA